MRKLYIILGFINDVNGGVIYTANKAEYMKSLGWDVAVLDYENNNVVIDSLKPYKDCVVNWHWRLPSLLTNKQREKAVDDMIRLSGWNSSYEETVIESIYGGNSLWGELMAKRINAKHLCFICTANLKQDANLEQEQSFFYFKHKRNELICITKSIYKELFMWNKEITDDQCKVLWLYCTNSVGDVESKINIDKSKYDYIIGSVGRLEKAGVPGIISQIVQFAKLHFDKKLAVLFVGSEERANMDLLLSEISELSNVDIYRTGTIFPIPLKLIKCMDVNIASCGSASVTDAYGAITIALSDESSDPYGIIGYTIKSKPYNKYNVGGATICDLLEDILIKQLYKNAEHIQINTPQIEASEIFKTHIEFMNNTCKEREYFDTSKIKAKTTLKMLMFTMFNKCFGYNAATFVGNVYKKLKG